MVMTKMQQLESLQRQINELDQHLHNLQADCRQIAMQQVRLREQITTTIHQLQLEEISRSVPPSITDSESALLVGLIKATGHAMTVRDIVGLVREKHPDFIPLQIIGVNGFVQRKLSKACQQGHLTSVDESHDLTRFYLLPEWLDQQGDLIPGFGHR